jgi:hypothetical protein
LLADGSNNAFITDTQHLAFLEKSLNGTHKFTVLKEVVLSDYLGFRFPNNDIMFASVTRIVGQLFESGIAKWIVDNEHVQPIQEESGPVPLSFHHLDVWFYVFLAMITVTTFVFTLEHCVRKLCHRKTSNEVGNQDESGKKLKGKVVKKLQGISNKLKKKPKQVKPAVELNAVFEID